MSLNKKKDSKNKQKTKNKAENELIKSVNSSKDGPTAASKSFNTSDPSFLETMEQLVSNDKEIREKAAQKTKEYMKESYTNTEELYEKISRSLFYFYWNTDKSAYQLAMAKLIASFIYINENDKAKLIPKHILWITTFLSEISNKFKKIDVFRLDKYIMMCDQVISTYLTACLENKFYKSIINLIKYFIKEIENNNNFNFTFESNKIKVMSRFVKLLLQENSDDKNELKNKEDYLNDEENGFIMFYKKLLMLYMTIKDKREIKNFTENIFDMLIKELVDNKKGNNNNIINKIKEKSESFLKENKPQLNGPKILAMQYFINKLKDEKFQKPIKEDNNVVDPVNDYIMKKNYMAKFKKSKEEIKKERLLEKEKKKELKNKQKDKEKEKEKENEDEEKKENLKKSDKKEKKEKKEEKKENLDKKDKKEKLSKLEDISKELDFENIKVEKELINLEEEEDKSEENEKENKKDNNKQNKIENNKEKKDKKENKKQNENKQKEKENKINKDDKKNKDKKKEIKNNEKNSSDDESLVEDSDEDEELLEENDDDDDDDSENNNDKMEKNKKLKEKIKLGKEEEDLDNNEEDEIDNEEDMMEEDDLDDEEYELNEDDLENYGNDLLMANPYSDKNTLKNTQINMKQGLLNKKTQRNFYRNNVDKNKKKKISFSMENNVVSIYNSKVPISLTSKKKNVFAQGGTTKQSLLKKNK